MRFEECKGESLALSNTNGSGYAGITTDTRSGKRTFSYGIPDSWHAMPGAEQVITKGRRGENRQRSRTFTSARDAAHDRAALHGKLQEVGPGVLQEEVQERSDATGPRQT